MALAFQLCEELWGGKRAKVHHACVAALATVGDTAETLPFSLKLATGHSADRKVTVNTAFTVKTQRERSGLNYLMCMRCLKVH